MSRWWLPPGAAVHNLRATVGILRDSRAVSRVRFPRAADRPVTAVPVATVPTVDIDAMSFSRRWVQAWNAHDVEAVLRHFHDDVVFTSPVAAELEPQTRGVVRGKPALRRYWTTAVQRIADLHFTVEAVYQGVDTIVINYRNQNDGLANEILTFDDSGLVIEGHGTYLVAG